MQDFNSGYKPLILIIDDSKENLHFLCDIFPEYRKAVSMTGSDGIRLAKSLKPDLILLDVLMPVMDGFEVCRHIKDTDELKDIPIIFLSGKSEVEDIVRGFRTGAIDYITKPFEQEELQVRVKNNLELKASRDTIKKQKLIVESLNNDMKEFLSIATHDLKNSLVVIQGFNKLLLEHFEKFSDSEKLEIIQDISITGDMMYKVLTNLSLITKLEAKTIVPYFTEMDFNYLLEESVNYFKVLAKIKNIEITVINKIKDPELYQDYNLLKECIDNLISNAVKFSQFNKKITIKVYSESINVAMESRVIFEVEDEGPGIIESEIPLIFEKFARLSSQPTNRELTTGLGLAITRNIVELIGGEISLESQYGRGTRFILKFPAIRNAKSN